MSPPFYLYNVCVHRCATTTLLVFKIVGFFALAKITGEQTESKQQFLALFQLDFQHLATTKLPQKRLCRCTVSLHCVTALVAYVSNRVYL